MFTRIISLVATLAIAAIPAFAPQAAFAASAAELNREAQAALKTLLAKTPAARALEKKAKGVLVFPSIVKAGLVVGGQYGEGVLYKGGKVAGYYNTAGASYGLQAGAQKFGYALFFMSDSALAYLGKSEGFEIGVGPSVVVMDEGMAKSTTTTTLKDEIYAFIFSQSGLMAGLGLQGNKITKLDKK
jgi:lipid-binding SYLF domain-containing protein